MAPAIEETAAPKSPNRRDSLLACLLIACGIALRTCFYLRNRGFWIDEAALANLVLHTPIASWLRQSGEQVAPIGFMLICRSAVHLFGCSDLTLRLVPYIGSICTLLLVPKTLRLYARKEAVVFGCALIAFGSPLIEYATEFKPYGMDVLFSCILLILLQRWESSEQIWKRALLTGLLGGLIVWFSFPAVFVMAGLGGMRLVELLLQRQYRTAKALMACIALWMLSFGSYFWIALRHAGDNSALLQFHQQSFAPFPPHSMAHFQWYLNAFLDLFDFPLGFDFRWAGLCAFLFVVGVRASWQRSREACLGLAGPIMVTLLASAIHRYPWVDRLLMFLTPCLAVYLGEGIAWTSDVLRQNWRQGPAILTGFIAVPLAFSALRPIRALTGPPTYRTHDVRGLMRGLSPKVAPGDTVYVYSPTWPVFEHYTTMLGYSWPAVVHGSLEIGQPLPDGRTVAAEDVAEEILQKAGAGRTWILMSHTDFDHAQLELLRKTLAAGGVADEPILSHGAVALKFERKP